MGCDLENAGLVKALDPGEKAWVDNTTWNPWACSPVTLFRSLGLPDPVRQESISALHSVALRRTTCDALSMPRVWAGWLDDIWWFLERLAILSLGRCEVLSPPEWVEKMAWEGLFFFLVNALPEIRNYRGHLLVYRATISWKLYPLGNWRLFGGYSSRTEQPQ